MQYYCVKCDHSTQLWTILAEEHTWSWQMCRSHVHVLQTVFVFRCFFAGQYEHRFCFLAGWSVFAAFAGGCWGAGCGSGQRDFKTQAMFCLMISWCYGKLAARRSICSEPSQGTVQQSSWISVCSLHSSVYYQPRISWKQAWQRLMQGQGCWKSTPSAILLWWTRVIWSIASTLPFVLLYYRLGQCPAYYYHQLQPCCAMCLEGHSFASCFGRTRGLFHAWTEILTLPVECAFFSWKAFGKKRLFLLIVPTYHCKFVFCEGFGQFQICEIIVTGDIATTEILCKCRFDVCRYPKVSFTFQFQRVLHLSSFQGRECLEVGSLLRSHMPKAIFVRVARHIYWMKLHRPRNGTNCSAMVPFSPGTY